MAVLPFPNTSHAIPRRGEISLQLGSLLRSATSNAGVNIPAGNVCAGIFPLFALLAKFKFLRGTVLDPFGYSEERRTERALVREYETMLEEVLARLNGENHHIAVGLAAIPEKIRGFGHVKMRHLKAAKADEAALLDQLRAGVAPLLKAAE